MINKHLYLNIYPHEIENSLLLILILTLTQDCMMRSNKNKRVVY